MMLITRMLSQIIRLSSTHLTKKIAKQPKITQLQHSQNQTGSLPRSRRRPRIRVQSSLKKWRKQNLLKSNRFRKSQLHTQLLALYLRRLLQLFLHQPTNRRSLLLRTLTSQFVLALAPTAAQSSEQASPENFHQAKSYQKWCCRGTAHFNLKSKFTFCLNP